MSYISHPTPLSFEAGSPSGTRAELEFSILEEERLALARRFRGFSPWETGSIDVRPVARRRYHGEGAEGRRKAELFTATRPERASVLAGFFLLPILSVWPHAFGWCHTHSGLALAHLAITDTPRSLLY